MIKFVKPEIKHKALAHDYIEEHRQHGETILHGSAQLDQRDDYAAWVSMVDGNRFSETVTEGWVPSSTFFVMEEDESKIIGMVDIRHELNDFLRNYGGHIGYGVRPSKRRQGYAKQILHKALQYCKTLGISRVMISCNEDNEASRRTILSCGGKLEGLTQKEGQTYQIYWITLMDVSQYEDNHSI